MAMTLPWWGAPESLPAAYPPESADLVIVGGGVMGLSTAYWLTRAGATPLVIEQEGSGAGATGRNGGFLAVGTTEPYEATIARFGRAAARDLLWVTRDNREVAGHLIAEEEIACDLRPWGLLHLSLGPEEDARLRRNAALLAEDGCATEWLDRGQLASQISTPLDTCITGGMFTPPSAILHSGKLVRGLAVAARRHGASFIRARTLRVEPEGNRARIVTDRGPVVARQALVAVNAWTGGVLPQLRHTIVPVRGQMLAFAPAAPLFRAGITAMWTATEEYWQQTPGGSIILGGCRAVGEGRDERILSTEPSLEVQHALEGVLPALFPRIGPLTVTHRWAGPMAFTPDRLPLIGPLAQLPACWVAGGFSGHGLAMAFTLGRLLAARLSAGHSDPRLGLFALERLAGATA
jgi:gamma-glutamylputrescine oxidase